MGKQTVSVSTRPSSSSCKWVGIGGTAGTVDALGKAEGGLLESRRMLIDRCENVEALLCKGAGRNAESATMELAIEGGRVLLALEGEGERVATVEGVCARGGVVVSVEVVESLVSPDGRVKGLNREPHDRRRDVDASSSTTVLERLRKKPIASVSGRSQYLEAQIYSGD